MSAIVGCAAWNHNGVPFAGSDLVVAPGAAVSLDRFVRLHAADVDAVIGVIGELVVRHLGDYPKNAQANSAAITNSPAATIAASPECFTRARNGL